MEAASKLFPHFVAFEAGDPEAIDGALYDEESASIERATEGRKREFQAGRILARRAMERLGVLSQAVLRGADRAPVWPREVVGSISHTKGFCGVAVALGDRAVSVGFDVERERALGPDLVSRICTVRERTWLAESTDPEGLATVVFSAKEAFYKCQYPLEKRFLGFQDAEVDLDLGTGTFRVSPTGEGRDKWPQAYDSFEGKVAIEQGLIFTAVCLSRHADRSS